MASRGDFRSAKWRFLYYIRGENNPEHSLKYTSMAIVHLQRAWYRPKYPVIHYVSQQRVLVRSRPVKVRNPRTQLQQANRGKMAVASRFLSHFQDFVAHGFESGRRPNGRPVGAYHVALGHLLNNAMRRENGQWAVDYESVQLSEGQSLKSFPLRVNRQGRTLRLSWLEGLPEGTHHIRLAFHNAKRGETLCLEVAVPKRGAAVEVLLPKWAKAGALRMWWLPLARGKARWRSAYLFLPEGVKLVLGGMVGRSRVGKGCASRNGGVGNESARGKGRNAASAGGEGDWGGGKSP